MALHGVVAV
jgi:hypothetical protein